MSKVLKLNQKTFRFMGYMGSHLISWMPPLIPDVVFTAFSAILMYANANYIWANSDNIIKSTGAVYVLTAMAVSIGAHVDVACKKGKVDNLFTDLAAIRYERTRINLGNWYEEAESRSGFYTKWAIIGEIYIFLSALYGFAFAFAAYSILMGNLDTSHWFSPYKVIMPFDETTIAGFMTSLVLQSCGGYTFMLVMMSIQLFYMGFYFYSVAFIMDFQDAFDKMDNSLHTYDSTRKQLIDLLQFHEKISDLTRLAVDILSGPIFFLLIFNIAFIATSLFQIEVGIMNLDPELSTSMMGTIIMMTLTFSMSLLGSLTTGKIAEVGDIAYNSRWHEYPIGMQKYIPPVVQHSQKPINFHGYHVVYCSLEVFMKLIKSAFSYYVMVRQISQI